MTILYSAQLLNKHQSLTGDLHPRLEEGTPRIFDVTGETLSAIDHVYSSK